MAWGVTWMMFFLDDPVWPTPPADGGPNVGSLLMMGAGRCFVLWAVGKALSQLLYGG